MVASSERGSSRVWDVLPLRVYSMLLLATSTLFISEVFEWHSPT